MKRWFLSGLVVVSTLVATNCGGPDWITPALSVPEQDQGHAYICLDLPDASLPGAHEAVAEWDHALHQWRHVVPVDHGKPWLDTCSIWVHEDANAPEDNDTSPRSHALAWASTIGGSEISMRKGWYEQDVNGILQHELGHTFGAQHVAGTLMNPRWSPHAFICPDRTTVAQVAAWYQINLDMLSYCY